MVISDIYRCINIVIVFILKCYNNSSIIKSNVITIKWEAIMVRQFGAVDLVR